MKQGIEKAFLDWSRDKNPKIQARGISAILAQRAKVADNAKALGTTRCVWPNSFGQTESRYLSRRVFMR